MEDNDKENNHEKIISSLELDRDMGFLQGHQANQGHDDNQEEDNEVEDNNKKDDNKKDDNDENGISAQGLDRDLGFSRECHGYQRHQP